jgi:hypothetical protein
VMTCECLLGIPALHNMSAVIDCRAGLMDFEDDNGEVQIFGKNRSKITDLVGYVDTVVENRRQQQERYLRTRTDTLDGGVKL